VVSTADDERVLVDHVHLPLLDHEFPEHRQVLRFGGEGQAEITYGGTEAAIS
jgi:hypothetical protein